MSDKLASSTHLESLRKEAKRWLKRIHAGNADAIALLQASSRPRQLSREEAIAVLLDAAGHGDVARVEELLNSQPGIITSVAARVHEPRCTSLSSDSTKPLSGLCSISVPIPIPWMSQG